MKTIENKTLRPIKVPLPGGKTLRLGPKQSGQVRDGAEEHGAVKRMVEAGTIAVYGGVSLAHDPRT
jgi:hypothetical protein